MNISIEEMPRELDRLLEENERLNNQLDFIKDQNKYIDKLEKMVKERNSIIKEAIEYINNCEYDTGIEGEEMQYSMYVPKLLKILKGNDKE